MKAIGEFLPHADIVKVSSEELDLLAQGGSEDEKAKNLMSNALNCKILIVTKGADGAVCYDRSLAKITQKAYKNSRCKHHGRRGLFHRLDTLSFVAKDGGA